MRLITRDRAGRRMRAVASVLGFTLATAAAVMMMVQAAHGYQLDLSVFRDAGTAFRHEKHLYSEDFPTTSGFRFIYPPFAAVVFTPMTWLSPQVLQLVWAGVNVALVWSILWACLRRLNQRRPAFVAFMALGPALLLEPVRSNFGFGQINIVLMALVVADCLRMGPQRLRGVCIGLAAAIKVTPAAFVLVLLARRDTRAIATAVSVVAATVVFGLCLRPRDSTWFWATEFFRDERAGGHDFSRNQAITGPLARLGLDGVLKDAAWLAAATFVAIAAIWAARRFARSGEHVACLGVVALAVLLAAPIAVTHHWVYCILLIPLVIAPQYRAWRPLLAIAITAFLIGPHFILESGGHPAAWESAARHLIGNAQFFSAAVLFVSALVAARRRPQQTISAEPVPKESELSATARR